MRLVFDTNVLISGMLFGGLPRLALQLATQEPSIPITSFVLMEEFERVLIEDFRVPIETAEAMRRQYQQGAPLVHPVIKLNEIAKDPSDNRVLECAAEGKADAIISGDRHLLSLKSFRKIPILTVREFVDIVHR